MAQVTKSTKLRLKLAGALVLACGGLAVVACSSSGDDNAPGSAGATNGGTGGTAGKGGTGGTGGAAAGSAGKGGGTTGGTGGTSAAGTAGQGEAGAAGGGAELASFSVKQTDLVSDQTDGTAVKDANLVNAWGIAINPGGQIFWVASNHGGTVPTYKADGTIFEPTGSAPALDPTVPPLTAGQTGNPTGQVWNSSATNATNNLKGDKFIVDTEDGQILGWQTVGSPFVQRAKKDGAIYKGLAIVGTGATQMLVATDFHDGTVDVYDSTYTASTTAGLFADATIPTGFAPFNVMPIGDNVYVTYAMQDADKEDDTAGPGNGYVNVFKTDGTFVKRLISGGALNSPWAVAMAPSNFGTLANTLLVGNFGDGAINAYDPTTGTQVGQLTNAAGDPLIILGLWDLKVGPAATATGPDLTKTLFFSAGPGGEEHGIFGKLEAAQ